MEVKPEPAADQVVAASEEHEVAIRLDLLASDLADLVRRADASRCREAAIAAAELAVVRSGVDDPRVGACLAAFRQGRLGETQERSAIEELVSALDNRQWDLQEQADSGDASQDEQTIAFTRARAASAVFFAGETDARVAAAEAIYEAAAAVEDLDELRAVLSSLLM